MRCAKRFRVLAPLNQFFWGGNDFNFGEFLQIKRFNTFPDLQELKDDLSYSELVSIGQCNHWLYFEYETGGAWTQSNIIIVFLLSLWLSAPTSTHVKHIFKFAIEPEEVGERALTRCKDHFQWNREEIVENVETSYLQEAVKFMELFTSIVKKRKRLWNALVMTAAGCMSYRWQVAFVNFSAAVETILTYKPKDKNKKLGITKRLAQSYACLTETKKLRRSKEYRHFIKLYKIRSKIVHGKMHELRERSPRKLELLSDFSNLLRKLWKAVLTDKYILRELEKSDFKREQFFDKTEKGYTPPKVKIEV